MTDRGNNDILSPRQLYTKSNPGLCGEGTDYTDPRAWYHSIEAKRLMRNFASRYESQLTRPMNDEQGQSMAKFVVDLPEGQRSHAHVTNYMPLARHQHLSGDAASLTLREQRQKRSNNNETSNCPVIGSSTRNTGRKKVLNSQDQIGDNVVNRITLNMPSGYSSHPNIDAHPATNRTKPLHVKEELGNINDEVAVLPTITSKTQSEEPTITNTLPNVQLPKLTRRELYDKRIINIRTHRKDTSFQDECISDAPRYDELRIPRHEASLRATESYRDTYLLRQKSSLKLKSYLYDEHLPRRVTPCSKIKDNQTTADSVKRISSRDNQVTKTTASTAAQHNNHVNHLFDDIYDSRTRPSSELPGPPPSVLQPETKSVMALSRCAHHGEVRGMERKNDDNKENVQHVAQRGGGLSKKGRKFVYTYPSDGLNYGKLNGKTNEKTSVVTLDMNQFSQPQAKRTMRVIPISRSLERFVPSDVSETRSLPASRNISASQHDNVGMPLQKVSVASEDLDKHYQVAGKPKKGYLRKFKRLEVFGEVRRPDTTSDGRIQLEDPHAARSVPIMRPPQHYRMDFTHNPDSWINNNSPDMNKPHITTESTVTGRTTILINPGNVNTLSRHQDRTKQPLRIEVSFDRGLHRSSKPGKGSSPERHKGNVENANSSQDSSKLLDNEIDTLDIQGNHDIQTVSNDIQTVSNDIQMLSNDIQMLSNDIQAGDSHDINTDDNHDIPSDDNHDIPPDDNHDIPSDDNHDIPSDDNHDIPSDDNHDIKARDNHDIKARDNHDIKARDNHDIKARDNHHDEIHATHSDPTEDTLTDDGHYDEKCDEK